MALIDVLLHGLYNQRPKQPLKVNISVYDPTSSKLCMQIAYWPRLIKCNMAFTIKGQTKAAVAFKGKFGIYGPIVFKLCVKVAYSHSVMFC